MPTFRRRPLTWLFVIATVCLDGLLASGGLYSVYRSLATGFLIGQMFVTGGWLASGRAHRLARAAVFVGATIALATLICIADGYGWQRRSFIQMWGEIFAVVAVFSGASAASTALVQLILSRMTRRLDDAPKLQFPLVELFGWMIVVAVASVALRFSDFAELASPPRELLFIVGSAGLAGAIYALLGNARGRTINVRLAIGMVVFVAFLFVAGTQDLIANLIWAFAYLAAWLFIQWQEAPEGASTPVAGGPVVHPNDDTL